MPRRIRGRRLLATDFRRLGLDLSEARVAVIRRAARQAASSLSAASDRDNPSQAEAELARLATSVYRLLDPRRRELLAERIQLLRGEATPVHAAVWWNQQDSPTSGLKAAGPDAGRPRAGRSNANAAEPQVEDAGGDGDDVLMMLADLRIDVPVRDGSAGPIGRALARVLRSAPIGGSIGRWFSRLSAGCRVW